MHGLNPFVERPEELETKSWIALAISALVHLCLMLWLVFRPVAAGDSPSKALENGEVSQPIALPRPAETKTAQPKPQPTEQQPTQPPPPPAPPPPPTRETPLGPDSKNPDALVPKEAGPVKPMTEPEPKPTKSQVDPGPPAEKPAETKPPSPAEQPPTQAANRIPRAGDLTNSRIQGSPTSPWGPPSRTPLEQPKGEGATAVASAPAVKEGSMGKVGQSGVDTRDWRPSFEEAAGRCVSIPDLGTNADGTPVLATVIGRVLQNDGRSPLGGAHLQIIGTPFSTFSDGNGEYRLEFDPKLLEQCRVQYVRVAADGYTGAMLTLSIGERVRSDDVVLRRH